MSHGPHALSGAEIESLPKEYQEAHEETFMEDLHHAIELYGQMTGLVVDQEYDKQFQEQVLAVLLSGQGNKTRVIIVKGDRESKNG